jgi:hypothetical protein
MNGNFVKADFENVFLAEEGEELVHQRGDSDLGTIRAIVLGNQVQCKADEDVQANDILVSALRGVSFHVDSTDYEVVGGVATCLNLSVTQH